MTRYDEMLEREELRELLTKSVFKQLEKWRRSYKERNGKQISRRMAIRALVKGSLLRAKDAAPGLVIPFKRPIGESPCP